MNIRWGILGCGDVVRKRVAQAILDEPHSQLVAACRRDETALRTFCDQFCVERAYASDHDLLADDDIDAVYIATPVNLHRPQAIAAAGSGKHILVEKPMALSVAECDEMISACEQNDVRLGIAYYRRFYPVIARVKQIIVLGEIGSVLSVSAVTATPFGFGADDDGYWRVIRSQGGGGALMDIGSHRINVFLDLFGEVSNVQAMCDTVVAAYDADDCASVLMRFQSGVHGVLQCYFGTPVDPDEFTVVGTKGRIVCAPLNDGELRLELETEQRTESHPPSDNFNAPLVADFVSSILEGCEPRVSGWEGRATSVVLEQAYGSSAKAG